MQAQHPLPKMRQRSWRQISRRQDHEADQTKRICQEVVTDQDQDRGTRAEAVAVRQVTTGEAVVEVTTTAEAQEAGLLPDRFVIGNGATGLLWRRALCKRVFTSNEGFLSLSELLPRESFLFLKTRTAW